MPIGAKLYEDASKDAKNGGDGTKNDESKKDEPLEGEVVDSEPKPDKKS